MKGLGSIETRAIGAGTGVLVVDALFSMIIITFTSLAWLRCTKDWKQAQLLCTGTTLLSIWCVLNYIDVIIHQAHARVTYSYILFDCISQLTRVVSNILVIGGVLKVIVRYEDIRPGRQFHLWIAVGLLWFLGMYQICLKFAVALSWLSFPDLNVLQSIAKASNAFAIAFSTFQFLVMLIITILHFNARSSYHRLYEGEVHWMLHSCATLSLRSFCEVIIIGQLDRHPTHLPDIHRARNVTYHLFSSLFVATVVFAIPDPKSHKEDPLLKREQEVVETTTKYVLARIEEQSNQGGRTAPPLSRVFDELKKDDLEKDHRYRSDSGWKRDSLREVKRMQNMYKGWEPIYIHNGDGSHLD